MVGVFFGIQQSDKVKKNLQKLKANQNDLYQRSSIQICFNLRTPTAGGEEIGTGIFVCKNNNELYLVTASHVANSCNQNTDVVISDSIGNATALKLTSFSRALQWKHHPIAD